MGEIRKCSLSPWGDVRQHSLACLGFRWWVNLFCCRHILGRFDPLYISVVIACSTRNNAEVSETRSVQMASTGRPFPKVSDVLSSGHLHSMYSSGIPFLRNRLWEPRMSTEDPDFPTNKVPENSRPVVQEIFLDCKLHSACQGQI